MSNPVNSTPVPKTARQSLLSTLLTLALAAGVGYGIVHAERAMSGAEAPELVIAAATNATSSSSVVSPTSGPAGTTVKVYLSKASASVVAYSNVSVTWNGQAASAGSLGYEGRLGGFSAYFTVVAPSGTGTITGSYSAQYFNPLTVTSGTQTGSFTFTYDTPAPPVVAPAITSLTPWSGSLTGGETVIISGTNLNGATAVTFDGTAGTIVGTTATELRVTTPAKSAGLVDVRVTTPGGQSPIANTAKYFYDDTTITYVLPSWETANSEQFETMANALQTRIGNGPKAKVGVSTFLAVNMNSYTLDPTNASAVRAELQSVLGSVQALAARSANLTTPIPIGLSLITAIRDRVDGVQTAAEAEDRRNVQWYGDTNGSATGWVTFSQYAKKLRRYQEAYIREFGTGLRAIQDAFPTVPIIVTGDGEVEMTFGRMTSLATENPAIGDYSPFAIAEFRDWVRGTGAYASGQPLELDRYILASRYTADATPGTDTSGDGHTFNANFGTNFTTWDLEVFGGDPWASAETVGAIPTAGSPSCGSGYTSSNSTGSTVCLLSTGIGFDAPRDLPISGGQLTAGSVFWQTWTLFRQEMVWRYNKDFARWITEGTGATGGVPNTRFFSAQVPADKLFTNSSGAPNDGGVRLLTGASPHWISDIRPYGGAGVTGYNANSGGCSTTTNEVDLIQCGGTRVAGGNGPFFKTTNVVAPLVSQFGRWAIVEWNPADPFSDVMDIYRSDAQTVRQYRPALLMPFKIPSPHWKVFDIASTTGANGTADTRLPFEKALRELMQGRTDGTTSENHAGIATAGGWQPRITWATPQRILQGTALSATQLNATANVAGTFTYSPALGTIPAVGTQTLSVTFDPTDPDYGNATASVSLIVDALPVMTVSPTAERLFAGTREINGTISSMTGTQLISVSFSNPNNGPWTATANNATAPWVTITNGSGTGASLFGIGINTTLLRTTIGNTATTATATVTVTATNVTSASATQTIPIRVTLGLPTADTVPIGQVDTPAQGTGSVQGSLGITGWVVDDRGVAAVKIYRDCLPFEAAQSPSPCANVIDNGRGTTTSVVFMGDANFVSGARPDIETLFPALPATNSAGWGFLVLTQMLPNAVAQLPNGGEGTFVIRVFAVDTSGKQTMLGRSFVPANPGGNDPTTISLVNVSQATVKPFGAIDTPAQGATVSGVVNNFGWALTPDADTSIGSGDISISQNGASTVFLNAAPTYAGNPLGQITFNFCRGTVGNPVPAGAYCDDDVSSIFGNPTPQASFTPRTSNPTRYRNLDAGRGPIGLYSLDTRTVANGVYQLQWSVLDNIGRAEGIGSRFITVLNSGGDAFTGARPSADAVEAEVASLRSAQAQILGDAVSLRGLARRSSDMRGRMGFNLNEPYSTFAADEDGVFRATVELQERIEIDLGGPVDAGYLVANGTMRALPAGSTLYDGTFHWSGVPGYLGDYELAFVRGGERIDVTVTVAPEAPSIDTRPAVRMHLDDARVIGTSGSGRTVEIGGWAYDPHAGLGAGVGAVHVWAKRVDVAGVQQPFFLGEATVDGRRPDVKDAFDDAPGTAGFGLFATLAPGTYEISSYVWVTRTRQFEDARTVTITVR